MEARGLRKKREISEWEIDMEGLEDADMPVSYSKKHLNGNGLASNAAIQYASENVPPMSLEEIAK